MNRFSFYQSLPQDLWSSFSKEKRSLPLLIQTSEILTTVSESLMGRGDFPAVSVYADANVGDHKLLPPDYIIPHMGIPVGMFLEANTASNHDWAVHLSFLSDWFLNLHRTTKRLKGPLEAAQDICSLLPPLGTSPTYLECYQFLYHLNLHVRHYFSDEELIDLNNRSWSANYIRHWTQGEDNFFTIRHIRSPITSAHRTTLALIPKDDEWGSCLSWNDLTASGVMKTLPPDIKPPEGYTGGLLREGYVKDDVCTTCLVELNKYEPRPISGYAPTRPSYSHRLFFYDGPADIPLFSVPLNKP